VLKIKKAAVDIKKMVDQAQVTEMFAKEVEYKEIKKEVEELKYLEKLSFQVLYREYQEALLRDNERPLVLFT
jgi:DNA-binding protein